MGSGARVSLSILRFLPFSSLSTKQYDDLSLLYWSTGTDMKQNGNKTPFTNYKDFELIGF